MIDTSTTKKEQLRTGYFQTGTGPERILILGSCRTLALTNYLDCFNRRFGNPFTIYRIDPHDFHWNTQDERVDIEAAVAAQERNSHLLDMLHSTPIFIHEYLRNYGMFNTDRQALKNIWQFGIAPRLDICLPNWHDRFVLFQDQLNADTALKGMVQAGGLTAELSCLMRDLGLAALDKFYNICRLTSFPEMADHFREWWTRKRFFWTGNHVSRHFTLYLFHQLNERFLHLSWDDAFQNEIEAQNLFSQPHTPMTQADVDAYGLKWDEPII
jgi:hypothetical protein